MSPRDLSHIIFQVKPSEKKNVFRPEIRVPQISLLLLSGFARPAQNMGWFDDNHWAGEAYNCGFGYMAQSEYAGM